MFLLRKWAVGQADRLPDVRYKTAPDESGYSENSQRIER